MGLMAANISLYLEHVDEGFWDRVESEFHLVKDYAEGEEQ